jgi:flagellar biosynthesis chaperone FliJ
MKTPFLIFSLMISTNFLYAQEEINKLTVERANLYQKYKETESLTSGLFGNRSKDDLQTTIDVLNEIIKKDSEILEELTHIQENSKTEFTNKYNELIRQNNELSRKNSELLDVTERHKNYTKENHQIIDETEQKQTLLISLLVSFGLIAVIYSIKYFVLKSEMKRVSDGILD